MHILWDLGQWSLISLYETPFWSTAFYRQVISILGVIFYEERHDKAVWPIINRYTTLRILYYSSPHVLDYTDASSRLASNSVKKATR